MFRDIQALGLKFSLEQIINEASFTSSKVYTCKCKNRLAFFMEDGCLIMLKNYILEMEYVITMETNSGFIFHSLSGSIAVYKPGMDGNYAIDTMKLTYFREDWGELKQILNDALFDS